MRVPVHGLQHLGLVTAGPARPRPAGTSPSPARSALARSPAAGDAGGGPAHIRVWSLLRVCCTVSPPDCASRPDSASRERARPSPPDARARTLAAGPLGRRRPPGRGRSRSPSSPARATPCTLAGPGGTRSPSCSLSRRRAVSRRVRCWRGLVCGGGGVTTAASVIIGAMRKRTSSRTCSYQWYGRGPALADPNLGTSSVTRLPRLL